MFQNITSEFIELYGERVLSGDPEKSGCHGSILSDSNNHAHAELLEYMIKYTRPETIFEIGTNCGLTALFIALICKQLAIESKIITMDITDNFLLVDRFIPNHKEVWKKYIKFIKTDSTRYLVESDFDGLLFDLIIIDGDHTYDGCKSDIINCLPMLTERGTMMIHDSTNYAGPVHKAIDDNIPTNQYNVYHYDKDWVGMSLVQKRLIWTDH